MHQRIENKNRPQSLLAGIGHANEMCVLFVQQKACKFDNSMQFVQGPEKHACPYCLNTFHLGHSI